MQAEGGKVKVTGIDNDYAFGSGPEAKKVKQGRFSYSASFDSAAHHGGMPVLLDARLADRIESLDETVMEDKLKALLSQGEVEATIQRFRELKAHAGDLREKGCVVSDWKDGKVGKEDEVRVPFEEFLKKKAADDKKRGEGYSSLFMRDFKEFAS